MRKEKVEKRKVKMDFPRKLFFLFSFLISHFSFVMAQDGETRFIQRLTWTGDEYARRYEVVIEREEGGTYWEFRRESTLELFVEVPLSPGKYRCLVIPYNFLDIAGDPSPWMHIEVLAALNPELDNKLPAFFLSKKRSGTPLYEMVVSGKNLIPGAEIFLLGPGDTRIAGGERIVPVEMQSGGNGTQIRLFFARDQLAAGNYELVVINPGGLMASRRGIPFPPVESINTGRATKPVLPVDIFVSAAWMPSFTIYDKKEDRFFGRDISLAGTALRFGATLSESFFGFNPGLELAASYSFMDADSGGRSHLWGIGLNLLVLKRLPGEKMALNFRLGAGYSIHFQLNMGVSFLLFVIDHLYLETGLDYAHWFTGKDMHPSSFRPWVGIGFCK